MTSSKNRLAVCIFTWMLALFLTSVAWGQETPRAVSEKVDGVWYSGGNLAFPGNNRFYPGRVTLSARRDTFLLEMSINSKVSTRIKLDRVATGNSKDNQVDLVVSKIDGSNLNFTKKTVLAVGDRAKIEIVTETNRRYRTEDDICKLSLYSKDSRGRGKPKIRESKRDLFRATKLNDPKRRRYYKTIEYSDWITDLREQTADAQIENKSTVDVAEARKMVAEDIKWLKKNGGWKGLNQSTISLKDSASYTMTNSSYGKRKMLIYSHDPNANIIYTLSRKGSGSIKIGKRTTNYPCITVDGAYQAAIKFSRPPEPGTLEREDRKVPITIITFGNAFGDYGAGVNFEKFGLESPVQGDVQVRILGKAVLAGLLENVRRESIANRNDFIQAIATATRNSALDSLIRELAPNASENELGYLNRFAQAIVSNDVTFFSLIRDSCREEILQELKRQKPELEASAKLVDFLVDLQLQKAAFKK